MEVPIIRAIVFWGLYRGSLFILGNYQTLGRLRQIVTQNHPDSRPFLHSTRVVCFLGQRSPRPQTLGFRV